MKSCWARVSSYPSCSLSIFHSFHPKDLSTNNNGTENDTEMVRVASLSAAFEEQGRFYVCSILDLAQLLSEHGAQT